MNTIIEDFYKSLMCLYLELPAESADDHHVKALAAMREVHERCARIVEAIDPIGTAETADAQKVILKYAASEIRKASDRK
jgi:hypothetical protein